MTEKLFNKLAVFTDIHFGKSNNSKQHNEDCLNFIDWFIEESLSRGCETFAFLGDWHHSRHSIKIDTLNYSLNSIEKLSRNFEKVFWIPGNHDLFYKEKRDIHSIIMARNLHNIKIIDEVYTYGEATFVPWIIGDEWKKLENIKSRYMFGHFELPSFYMNAMVQMPDHGGLRAEHFKNQEYVFSGHFHKRQIQNNIIYIGNAFPHNFADNWDDDRGAMFLEFGGKPEFVSWPGAPKYRTIKLSELLDDPEKYVDNRTYSKINLDLDITYEEALFIKESLHKQLNIREISLINNQDREEESEFDEEIKFESVDQIVTTMLKNTDSAILDTNLLIDIYRSL